MSETMQTTTGRSPDRVRAALNWLTRSRWSDFVLIFALAFGFRIYSLRHIPVINLLPSPDRELSSIATSLAETGRFADPYMIPTGPTAHLPPIPPAILALIYYWFGRTNTAGYLFVGFIIATCSLIHALMPWIADRLGAGRQAGFVGGLMGAFIVELEQPDHGEGLAAILLGLMLVAFLQRWNCGHSSLVGSILLGLGIGVSFHVQPALLPVFLGCLAFEIGWYRAKRKAAITGMLVLGVILACVPWAWRNYIVFHDFFFIRDNLGLELRMGNHENAFPTMEMMDRQGWLPLHPRVNLTEARKLTELGETEYMQQALDEALAWIWENPLEFLKLSFLRFMYFWLGPLHFTRFAAIIAALTMLALLGARRIMPRVSFAQKWLIIIPLATYPLIYYLVPYMPRYRIPVDWMLFLLAGLEVWAWIKITKIRVGRLLRLTVGRGT